MTDEARYFPADYPTTEPLPGVHRQPLAFGGAIHLVKITFAAGARVPLHQHPQEQVTTVVSGTLHLFVGSEDGDPRTMQPGESAYVAGNVPHAAYSPDGVVVYEIYSPIRPDSLPPVE